MPDPADRADRADPADPAGATESAPEPIRVAVALLVVLALVLALPAGCVELGSGGGGRGGDRARAEASPPGTTPSSECTVNTVNGPRALTGAEAKAATALAARGVPPAATADGLAIGRALDGSRPAALSCAYPRRLGLPEEPMGPTGLTPRAVTLRHGYEKVFGVLPAGGFAPGGISSGHVDNSAHYSGRAIDVFFRPISAANRREGWVFAQWLVAHADVYNLLSIIFDDRIWTVWASSAGWRPYVHPSGNIRNPVLRHLDHVHVAVVRGGPPRRL